MKTNHKSNITFILCSIFLTASISNSRLAANTNIIPGPFRGQDQNSTITISYSQYSKILKASVMVLGNSTREKAPKPRLATGSRIRVPIKIKSAIESNRFLFENFLKEENMVILTKIRKDIEHIPEKLQLSSLNDNEQLAFWLNLYNISLIEQLSYHYPIRKIEDDLYKNGIMDNKFLNISGIELSLNDIQNKIIFPKFGRDPILMYGLFQGTIGAPNIRPTAFTGKNVMSDLRDNAFEFINSNRGTYVTFNGVLRVSTYYEHYKQLFPDFNKDLRKHLSIYLNSDYAIYLDNSNEFEVNIKNMNIVNLGGGMRKSSSAGNTNNAALMGAFGDNDTFMMSKAFYNSNLKGYSPYTIKLLMKLKEKYNLNKGKVIITEDEYNNNSDSNTN